MNRRVLRIVIGAALAVLVTGLPHDALAKKKKGRVKATINGKVVKLNKNVSITAGGDTVAFFLIAQTRPRGLLRTVGIGCGLFTPSAIPGPGQFCTANYQETRISRNPTLKLWADPVGETQVTFDAYDGQQISGRFAAELPSVSGDPPVRIEGEFRGPIQAAQ